MYKWCVTVVLCVFYRYMLCYSGSLCTDGGIRGQCLWVCMAGQIQGFILDVFMCVCVYDMVIKVFLMDV